MQNIPNSPMPWQSWSTPQTQNQPFQQGWRGSTGGNQYAPRQFYPSPYPQQSFNYQSYQNPSSYQQTYPQQQQFNPYSQDNPNSQDNQDSIPPFPERLSFQKPESPSEHDFLDELKNLCIKIPLLQAIKNIPIYAKTIKDLCLKKARRKKK